MTTDIKFLARRRIAARVSRGTIPAAVDLPCSKCGVMWNGSKERHAYHHYKGYEGENAGIVEPLCPTCHRKEHPVPLRTSPDYNSRSFRLDEEVYVAIRKLPESLNQYLRRTLLTEAPKPRTMAEMMEQTTKRAMRDFNRDPIVIPPHATTDNWRANRKPLLKPGEK